MALITLPENPGKGTGQTYTLDTQDLYSLLPPFFADEENISSISLIYVSTESNQSEIIKFTPSGQNQIQSTVTFSSQARDNFELRNILVIDKQRGKFQLERSEIPDVSLYDIALDAETEGPGDEIIIPGENVSESDYIVWDIGLKDENDQLLGQFGPQGAVSFVPEAYFVKKLLEFEDQINSNFTIGFDFDKSLISDEFPYNWLVGYTTDINFSLPTRMTGLGYNPFNQQFTIWMNGSTVGSTFIEGNLVKLRITRLLDGTTTISANNVVLATQNIFNNGIEPFLASVRTGNSYGVSKAFIQVFN